MSRFRLIVTSHNKNKDNFNSKEKKYKINTSIKMTEILELHDKDFKVAL